MKAMLNFKGKRIEISNIKKCSGLKKYIGLMFKKPGTSALLFEFKKPTRQAIHSFFCPDFLAIWLDEKNKILEYKLVNSNQLLIKPTENFLRLLEIPVNEKYSKITELFLEDRKKSLNTSSSCN